MTTILNGLRKRTTYDSLVGYLDGGQEIIKYPDRLATQLQNSYQISNLVDSEGKGWFQENKEQIRNFTEQQVKDILIKATLESGQTYQQEKILEQQQLEKTQREEILQMREEEAQQQRERQEMAKEDGIVDMFKKCKNKGSRSGSVLSSSKSDRKGTRDTRQICIKHFINIIYYFLFI